LLEDNFLQWGIGGKRNEKSKLKKAMKAHQFDGDPSKI
jgi:hypothetical protein